MDKNKLLIVALWIQFNQDWDKIYNAINDKQEPAEVCIKQAEHYITSWTEENILVPTDKEYTDLGLHYLHRPPFVVNIELCR